MKERLLFDRVHVRRDDEAIVGGIKSATVILTDSAQSMMPVRYYALLVAQPATNRVAGKALVEHRLVHRTLPR